MGGCGQIKCTNVNQTNTCDIALETDYKFYLSFENSLCEQYVTEKFFRRMDQKVVPIVMGKAHYRQMAPPHSHINVQDFHNPKELADYLRHLDKSQEDYLSYFWWKDHFRVRPGKDCFEKMMCRLCEKLNSELTPQSYNDMTSWWRHNGNCQLGSWTLWYPDPLPCPMFKVY